MKTATIITLAALFAVFTFQSCSSDDDEQKTEAESLNNFNLTDLNGYIGTWIVSQVQKADGSFAFTSNTDDRAWVISDSTITRQVGVYNFKCPYTFSNGTFTADDGVLTKYTRTFRFEHYNQYRLKVTVTSEGTNVVYLVYKQD